MLACCAFIITQSAPAEERGTRLQVAEIDGKKVIRASGFDETQWNSLAFQLKEAAAEFDPIRLYVLPTPKSTAATPAVFGNCYLDLETRSVIFNPRYPLMDGVRYQAELRWARSDKAAVTIEILTEKTALQPTTKVTQIYPTAHELPENLLKFYVHFSAPMSSGQAYRHIELVSDDGKQLMHPFLEIAEELWDPSGQRLTLLLDPARVKRGLVPHEEDGAILFSGTKYHLTIKRHWRDASGNPLVADYKKSFTAIASDYTQPKIATWKLVAPRGRTREPLIIDLQESVDHAIVTRGIRVIDSQGRLVDGRVSLAEFERIWRFEPIGAWHQGEYTLQINDRIEDLVGNSIAKPFEVDRFDEVESPAPRHVQLSFKVD